jgi:hypothetical protein
MTKTVRLAGGVALASITALVVAACGGSSSHTTSGTTTQQARQVTIASPDVGVAPAQARAHGDKRVPATKPGSREKQAARYPSGPDEENNGTGATSLDPCKLVSRSEVQGIAHHAVTGQISAPLGPTCIYQLRGARSDITVAVESAGFQQLVRQMKKSRRVDIRGRTGYCGGFGKPTLYLSLGGGRVLSVSAACGLGVPIADKALGRLGA